MDWDLVARDGVACSHNGFGWSTSYPDSRKPLGNYQIRVQVYHS